MDSSDIDLWNIDLLQTRLDFLDTDIPSKHLACPHDILKTSSRRLQCNNFSSSKTSSRCLARYLPDVFRTPSRRLGRRKIVTLKTCWRRLQDMSWRRLQDVLNTKKCLPGIYLYTIYTPFQIIFCWFYYILFYLFTANLLLLIVLASSNSWKPLTIFAKISITCLIRFWIRTHLANFLNRLVLLIYICLLKEILKNHCSDIEQLIVLWGGNVILIKLWSTCNLITVTSKPHFYVNWIKTSRDVFRTQLNIYDGAFREK